MKKQMIYLVFGAVLTVELSACKSADKNADIQEAVTRGSEEATEETDLKPDEKWSSIIPKETVTLDVYSQITNYEGPQEGWFAQVLLDKFNVKLNITSDGEDGVFENRATSGDLGDIVIFGNDTEQYHAAIEQGLLLDWEQNGLLDQYGSDMKENMGKALEKNRQNSGGRVYGFGYDVALDSGEIADFAFVKR